MSAIKSFLRYTINEKSEVFDTLKKRVIKQCNNSNGYKVVNLTNEEGNRKLTKIHRLVFENFILKEGDTMPTEIDHIDNNRANNQISNLRAATHQENQRNKPKYKNNKSGFKNIRITRNGNFEVYVNISKDDRYYKTFKTIQEAIDYATRMRDEHHGDFARH